MNRLNLMPLASQLTTQMMGHPLVYAPRLTSTQTLAARLAGHGWPEGTAVLTEEQTAGRGRQGRSWWAPFGQALLLSLLLRPPLPPHRSPQLTLMAGLAAAEAIEAVCAVPVMLKWPNDLYVRGRKVGGILAEARLSADSSALEHVILGIGINVTVDFAGQPALQPTATSLHTEAGHAVEDALGAPGGPRQSVDRGTLLLALLSHLEARYQPVLGPGPGDTLAGRSCHAEWAGRLLWLGERVKVVTPQGVLAGVARGVDETDALLVQRADGQVETVWSGDVELEVKPEESSESSFESPDQDLTGWPVDSPANPGSASPHR
jgi:BirA family biotin operon repressor/biotin-[acetyl-CoA-carboxylase] ligase